MTELVNGVDLYLLLEDLAYAKKRITELENNQETIVKFLRARHPGEAHKLTKLLKSYKESSPKKKVKTNCFGQEDDGLTTEQALKNNFSAKHVSVDPISQECSIIYKDNTRISASLGR